MDTHRPLPLVLIIVNMPTPHMRQREIPQCMPRLSPLRLHSGLAVVELKVKNSIIIQDLLPTHSQRKLISSHCTPRRRTRQELTKSTHPLDPLAVVLDRSHRLLLPWRLGLFLPVRLPRSLQGRSLRRQGPRVLPPDLLQLPPLLVLCSSSKRWQRR